MAFSEISFGARLENARRLLEQLKTFNSYSPLGEKTSVVFFQKLIAETTDSYNDAIDKIENYSNGVEQRQQLYTKSPDALTKLLSPIVSTVRSMYGKQAKQSETIINLAVKIRGGKAIKPAKNADADTISQSQRSYGNMAQGLKDILTILSKYKYDPANPKITTKALQNLHKALLNANQTVSTSYAAQKQARNKRQQQYETLNDTAQRIKEAIKSQYGPGSAEYKLVKGLKI